MSHTHGFPDESPYWRARLAKRRARPLSVSLLRAALIFVAWIGVWMLARIVIGPTDIAWAVVFTAAYLIGYLVRATES